MKVFSTFSGIGGFEIGIHNAWLRSQDKGQTVQGTQARDSQGRSEQLHQYGDEGLSFVGYSEIDKYATKVYEKQFKQKRSREERGCEFAELRTNISNKNYDIISVWKQNYANAADRLKINRQEEGSGRGAELAETNTIETDTRATQKSKNASKNKQQILSEETQKKLSNILSDITLCEDSECSICTEDNVFVAESLKRSSSPLNTETETEILTESDTELAICINSPSKLTVQKNTKSYATTVITQKGDIAYAHINRKKPIRNFGDITQINAEELPDFDCLVGGFPCQAFSIAGKRAGFEDTRGTLFFDLARILRAKQPRLFVFENVKGLLSHDSGRTFKTIIEAIDELGYDCQWQVLNSKNHGVPQNRERIYIVGHLRGTPRPEVFPITGDGGENINSGIVGGTLTTRYQHSQREGSYIEEDGNGTRESVKIRRLTPLECERLQGFPDNWTADGVDGAISDTQRYKMCGNAVTTNVVQAVFERILN